MNELDEKISNLVRDAVSDAPAPIDFDEIDRSQLVDPAPPGRGSAMRFLVSAAAIVAAVAGLLSFVGRGDDVDQVKVTGERQTTVTAAVGTSTQPTRSTTTTSEQSTSEPSRGPSDPAWIPIGPLRPRGGQITAWTGNELLIYGGILDDPTTSLTDGAAYSPSDGQWRSIAPPPQGTGSTSGVWTGAELLVLSGAMTAFYDPTDDSWRTVDSGAAAGMMIYAETAYVWNSSGVRRFENEEWVLLPELPDGFTQSPLDQWNAQILAVDGVITVVSNDPSNCSGRRIAQFGDGRWIELPAIELTSVAAGFADCSWANQVAAIGDRIVAWESRDFSTELFDPEIGEWVEIETIPISASEGGTGGVAVGDDLLVPQLPASVLDAETLTWRVVELPGGGFSDDMVWTGDRLLMWGDECCYGTGRPVTTSDAWQWTPP